MANGLLMWSCKYPNLDGKLTIKLKRLWFLLNNNNSLPLDQDTNEFCMFISGI